MSLTRNGWNPELIFVHWCGGVWKVIDYEGIADKYLLRWVRGPRPDPGVLHWISRGSTSPISDMEVIAIMADDRAVP